MLGKRFGNLISEPWQRTLYITFVAQMITAIGFSSIFPFLPLYVESLGSTTQLSTELLSGLVYSAQAFCMMIASPIWGALADRFGRKLMVQRSSFGGAAIIVLMAFARTAEQLVLLRAIQGLITGTVAAASALIAAEAPRSRAGYAMGLLQVSLGIGIALGPLIGGSIADSFGYSAAFFVTSGLLLFAGVLVFFGVEETYEPAISPSINIRALFSDWRKTMVSPGVTVAYAMQVVTQLGRMMVVPIVPIFIQSLMPDPENVNTVTGLIFGVYSTSMTLSAIFFGRLGDRVGHRTIMIASAFAAGLFYLPQAFADATWQMLVLQALVGITMGGILPSVSALLANLTRQGEEGVVYGLSNSLRAGARSVAPLLGAGFAIWFDIRSTFAFAAIFYILAAILAAVKLPRTLPESSGT